MALSGTLDRFVHIYYVHLLSFSTWNTFSGVWILIFPSLSVGSIYHFSA